MVLALSAQSATLADVTMPDSMVTAGKHLVLNGIGVRLATVLKVKVYVVGLYLEKRNHVPDQIIASTETKHATMQFVRDVEVAKLREGWQGGFEKNAKDLTSVKDNVDRLLAVLDDMKTGDRIEFDFVGSRMEMRVKGMSKLTVDSQAFQQAILSLWMGPQPPNPEIKSGVLGL
jgi:hypothetical protein